MIQNVLIWLATQLLQLAVSWVFKVSEEKIQETKEKAADGKVDAGNLKKLEEAKLVEERVKAGLDLLNGTAG